MGLFFEHTSWYVNVWDGDFPIKALIVRVVGHGRRAKLEDRIIDLFDLQSHVIITHHFSQIDPLAAVTL